MSPNRPRQTHQIPLVALLIGLLTQTLVTMAAYSVPAAAPAIAADLQLPGEQVGLFVALIYATGMLSAIMSPPFIHRYGAVRISQFIVFCGILMMTVASQSVTVIGLAVAAVLLGGGYGATAPSSSHLLMRRTPSTMRNTVFSIRQIGVPLGGVLSGLIVPPIVLGWNWQTAIGVQLLPAIALLLWLQTVRVHYDNDRNRQHPITSRRLIDPLILLRKQPEIRPLSFAVMVFAGIQLCFIAFMSVHLTEQAQFDLVGAGLMLATYQIAGVISRPIWGMIADRVLSAKTLLGLMGIVMAIMALLTGLFNPMWSPMAMMTVVIIAGATASGYTGVAFAEFARIGGKNGAAEATGLGAFTQFFGVMILPAVFSLLVSSAGYLTAYTMLAILGVGCGLGLLLRAAPTVR